MSDEAPARYAVGVERSTLVRAVLIALGIWAIANLLWLSRDIIFLTLFAVIVATFLSIFVDPLERAGAKRGVVAPLVFLALVIVVALIVRLAWPTLAEQLTLLKDEVPQRLAQIGAWIESQYITILGADQQDGMEQRLRQQLLTGATGLLSGTLPLLSTMVGALSATLIVMFAAVYMTIDPRQYRDGLVRLAPPEQRPVLSEALNEVATTLRRWLIATMISMTIIAVFTTSGLLLLGIPAASARPDRGAAPVRADGRADRVRRARGRRRVRHLAAARPLGDHPLPDHAADRIEHDHAARVGAPSTCRRR